MRFPLAQTALYLNAATQKIKNDQGSLQFLTGNAQDTINTNHFGGQTQETQCMVFKNTLWVANNDDNDTDLQRLFVNEIGARTARMMFRHVADYGSRVLNAHQGNLRYQLQATPHQRVLYTLRDTQRQDAAEGATLDLTRVQAVANSQYSLASQGLPNISGIVFIRGHYPGVDNGQAAEHAEQKLLYALLKIVRQNGARTGLGKVHCAGCKVACSTCVQVLSRAQLVLRQNNIDLFFYDTGINRERARANLNPYNAQGIRELDIQGVLGQ